MSFYKKSTERNNKRSWFIPLSLNIALAIALFIPVVQAEPIVIQVVNMNNQPLNHAVVEVIKQTSGQEKLPVNGEPVVMDQVNKQFLPDLILIQQGESVSFPNSDNIRHHVYSFSKTKPFELKLYAGKPEKPIEFNDSGVVIVGCNIHDSMVGSIYVAQNSAMITDDSGKVTLDIDPLVDQISVWHPLQKENPESRKIIDLNASQFSREMKAYRISIDINPPAPRDTFRDTF